MHHQCLLWLRKIKSDQSLNDIELKQLLSSAILVSIFTEINGALLIMKKLVVNILLFPVTVFPVVALTALVFESVFGDLRSAEPGSNPVFWLIYTAPWVAPAIILTPIIHIVIGFVSQRTSRVIARLAALILSIALFSLFMLVLWGPKNFKIDFVFPIAIAGLIYGGVIRIAENTNHASKTNST